MKELKHWIGAAILCCGLVMTSCVDDQMDNPAAPEPEQTPTMDQGRWWIDESNMDKTVKPGDDFYMYCLGSWWKNTVLPANRNYVDRFDFMKPTFTERVSSLTDSNYETFRSHMTWAEDGSEAEIAGQKAYDDVLARSGLNGAKTPEEILKAFGKMGAMGAPTCVWLDPFFHDGKVCFFVTYRQADEFATKVNSNGAGNTPAQKRPSFREVIKQCPELLSHLVSLGDKACTRAISDEWSAIRNIVEGMDINPEYVFVYADYINFLGKSEDATFQNYIKETNGKFKDSWQGVTSVAKLRKAVNYYYESDYGYISRKMKEVFEQDINVGNTLTPLEITFKRLEAVMADYMRYTASKMVAEQMMPKGLKEEYLKYCQELKAVFAQRIKDNDWLSEGSKQNALDKLDAMIFNVGYPDKWLDEGLPDFSKNKSLIEDIYSIRKARLDLFRAIAGKSREEAAFTVTAAGSMCLAADNAYYDSNMNSMNMLPYYMLPPFYDPTQSMVINYQCFDTMGHEMTHGFDTNGSKFDKYGNYKEGGIWANAADKAEFDRRADLLVKCYESLDVLPGEMPGVKAVGKGTLAENIADLGGTEMAYQAFLNHLKAEGYTGDRLKLMKQRFFLAFAEEWRSKYNANYVNRTAFGTDGSVPDNHSLDKERVNGVVANMDGWYDAFDIKDGTLYRKPEERVKIW